MSIGQLIAFAIERNLDVDSTELFVQGNGKTLSDIPEHSLIAINNDHPRIVIDLDEF